MQVVVGNATYCWSVTLRTRSRTHTTVHTRRFRVLYSRRSNILIIYYFLLNVLAFTWLLGHSRQWSKITQLRHALA